MTNKRKTILIVDDEPNIKELVSVIPGNDYSVLKASDGKEAIDIARSQKPDLILMDIMIPETDGYTACYAIKTDKATRAIPVVMLTALGYELNRELGRQVGADGYITKPFSYQKLRDMIGQFLANPDQETRIGRQLQWVSRASFGAGIIFLAMALYLLSLL